MNYKLITYDKFRTPIDGKDYTGYEMRGLCYIFDIDGSLFKRYLLLPKFFNLNQVDESQYSLIKDKEVKSVYLKEDGSIISFIRLPNGKVLAKSKMAIESTQSLSSLNIYNTNSSIKKLVDWSLDNDIVLMFEYVSPFNRIVVMYNTDELILLRARNNSTGELIDLSEIPSDLLVGIKTPLLYNLSLDDAIELSKTIEGIEGWVYEFIDGTLIKIKTDWYNVRHHIMTDCLNRENDLVRLILDEKIDDLLSNLGDSESDIHARNRINLITKIVYDHISDIMSKVNSYYELNWNGSAKDLAAKSQKEWLFSLVMKKASGADVVEYYKSHLLRKLFRLENCRTFLYKNGLKDKINELQ